MSKAKDRMIEDIARTTGVDINDVKTVIDRLCEMSVMDDLRARQYAAVARVMEIYVSTDMKERTIHGIVAEEMGLTPQGVGYLQRRALPRT